MKHGLHRAARASRVRGLRLSLLLLLGAATAVHAQITTVPDTILSYPGCANLQASDFSVTNLVRGSGTDPDTREPLKMAFATDAQGRVDVYFVQRHGMVRRYTAATNTTITLANFAFGSGTSLTDSTQVCANCPTNGTAFSSSEGLIGIALDPGFKTNGWVYLYVTMKSVWRVTRYTLTGSTLDLASGKTIWRATHPSFSQHMGGALRFDKDGSLWITVGDNASTGNATAPYAPNLRYLAAETLSPFGKILRIKPRPLPDGGTAPAPGPGSTYDVPAGNLRNRFPEIGGRPSQDTAKIMPEIYVMGTRNAYTLSLDTVRGGITWGDVGPDFYAGNSTNPAQQSEEFNFATRPGNFGYPYWVGSHQGGIPTPNTIRPAGTTLQLPLVNHDSGVVRHTGIDTLPPAVPAIVSYGKACAVTGPVYYYDPLSSSQVKFPPHFHGAWFTGDFNRGWIDALALNANGTAVTGRMKAFVSAGATALSAGYLSTIPTNSLLSTNSLLEMEMGPDGALYVLHYGGYRTTSASTGIFRIEYKGPCRPTALPVAFHRERSGTSLASLNGRVLKVVSTGAHRVELRTIKGGLVWSRRGFGAAEYDLRRTAGRGQGFVSGMHVLSVTTSDERFVRRMAL